MSEQRQIKNQILIYKPRGGDIEVEVKLERETIWLTLNQIAYLFGVQKAAISKHIKNIFSSGELDRNSTVSKMETVQVEGKRKIKRKLAYFNLDVIIAVGYRVNSFRATQFRIWATKVLKNYLLKGYAINEKRLLEAKNKFTQLQKAITFLQEKSKHKLFAGQGQEILSLLANYSKTLTLLERYDKGKLSLIKKTKGKFVLKYKDAKQVIEEIKKDLIIKKEASELFGQENNEKLKGILGNIYQSFGGKKLYTSLEEKAANLLYLIIKDHPFVDGNKRIASFLFVYFLDKNNFLYRENGERKVNDSALASLALLIAISNPKDKELLIKIITNILAL